jgi:hypothetical protein
VAVAQFAGKAAEQQIVTAVDVTDMHFAEKAAEQQTGSAAEMAAEVEQ